MAHKYLNKLGIKSDDPCVFNSENKRDKRIKRFNKQRAIYGFDERETWSMDYTLATWLYEHLKAFKHFTICNLDYHTFDIPVLYPLAQDELEFADGYNFPNRYTKEVIENHTQGESIDYMIDYLKHYLVDDKDISFDSDCQIETEMRGFEYYQGALKIFTAVCGAMWW